MSGMNLARSVLSCLLFGGLSVQALAAHANNVSAPGAAAASETLRIAAASAGCPTDSEGPFQCLLQELYPRGAGYSRPEREAERASVACTYGELNADALETLLSAAALFGVSPDENDAFADLGSGIGRLPIFAFLQDSFARVIGVESVGSRASVATIALERLSRFLAEDEDAKSLNLPDTKALHAHDDDESCTEWAKLGKCSENPDMLSKCPHACSGGIAETVAGDPMLAPAPSGNTGMLEHHGRRIELVQGDMLEHPLEGLTLVIVSVPWLPSEELGKLLRHLITDLAPGAAVWSLVELPLHAVATAGSGGLVLVNQVLVKTSWSSHAVATLYMRVPSSSLPFPPPLVVSSPLSAISRQAWTAELRTAAGLELTRLKAAAAAWSLEQARREEQDQTLSEDEFEYAARALYDTSSRSAALRLMHSFGTAGVPSSESDSPLDTCGCTVLEKAGLSYTLGATGLLSMLTHGMRLVAAQCPGGFPCTVGDVMAEEVITDARECLEKQQAQEDAHAVPGAAQTADLHASKCGTLRGLGCLRFSDGSTLLHTSLGRNDLTLAAHILQALGKGAWQCRDARGHMPAQVAATAARILSERHGPEGAPGAAELVAWAMNRSNAAPITGSSAHGEGGIASPDREDGAARDLQEASPAAAHLA